jgi:hypothetical protein
VSFEGTVLDYLPVQFSCEAVRVSALTLLSGVLLA